MRGLYKEIEKLACFNKGLGDNLGWNVFIRVSLALEIDLGNSFRVLIFNTEKEIVPNNTKWTYKKKLWNDTR